MKIDPSSLIERVNAERIAGMHVLADWWFAKFKRPRHDNGDTTGNSFMAGMMAGMVADKYPVDESDANRDKFRDALVAATQPIDADYWHDQHVGTDYHPDRALSTAMEACGVHGSRAPWKTDTHTYGSGLIVQVRDGYRAPTVTVYIAPIMETLIALDDAAIDVIEAGDVHRRIRVSYAVSEAMDLCHRIAAEARHRDASAMAYVIDGLARARAFVGERTVIAA